MIAPYPQERDCTPKNGRAIIFPSSRFCCGPALLGGGPTTRVQMGRPYFQDIPWAPLCICSDSRGGTCRPTYTGVGNEAGETSLSLSSPSLPPNWVFLEIAPLQHVQCTYVRTSKVFMAPYALPRFVPSFRGIHPISLARKKEKEMKKDFISSSPSS